MKNNSKKKVLVHVCCAPCATYSFEKLINDGYEIVGFFYNPNIHPASEYEHRLNSFKEYLEKKSYKAFIAEYDTDKWFEAVKGLESEPEGGSRCAICFKIRLKKAFQYAKENNFDAVATVLSISPHKNLDVINEIGEHLCEKYGVEFLKENFKKNDGFRKSIVMSKEYNLYRQKYCGCSFSINQV